MAPKKNVAWFNRTKEELRKDISNIKKDKAYLKRMNTGLSKKIASLETKLKESKYAYKNNVSRIRAHDEMIQQLSAKLRRM